MHISIFLDPSPWSMHLCMMYISIILDPDACMYNAYIYPDTRDYDPHICMMHLSMILNPDICMYDAYTYVPRSFTLKHAFVYDVYIYDTWSWYMHIWCIYLFLDPWLWRMCVWCTYLWFWTWSWSMHVCLVHVSMMRQILSATDERTNEQGDSRSLICCLFPASINIWCAYWSLVFNWPPQFLAPQVL